jgi:hypothetical protein
MDHLFFMWSIAEAWDFLVHLPILGFVSLIVFVWFIICCLVAAVAVSGRPWRG